MVNLTSTWLVFALAIVTDVASGSSQEVLPMIPAEIEPEIELAQLTTAPSGNAWVNEMIDRLPRGKHEKKMAQHIANFPTAFKAVMDELKASTEQVPQQQQVQQLNAVPDNNLDQKLEADDEADEPKTFQEAWDKLDDAAGRKAFETTFSKLHLDDLNQADPKSNLDDSAFDRAFEKLNAAAERGEALHAKVEERSPRPTPSGKVASSEVAVLKAVPTTKSKVASSKVAVLKAVPTTKTPQNEPLAAEPLVIYGQRQTEDALYLLLSLGVLAGAFWYRNKLQEALAHQGLPTSDVLPSKAVY